MGYKISAVIEVRQKRNQRQDIRRVQERAEQQ
jgi:hypothetical protein